MATCQTYKEKWVSSILSVVRAAIGGARKSRGWSQTRLAQKLQTTQKMIDHYERRAVNPSFEFIQRAARVREVSPAELVGSESETPRSRPGPPQQLASRFEQIRRLPCKEHQFVIRFLDTILDKAGRG